MDSQPDSTVPSPTDLLEDIDLSDLVSLANSDLFLELENDLDSLISRCQRGINDFPVKIMTSRNAKEVQENNELVTQIKMGHNFIVLLPQFNPEEERLEVWLRRSDQSGAVEIMQCPSHQDQFSGTLMEFDQESEKKAENRYAFKPHAMKQSLCIKIFCLSSCKPAVGDGLQAKERKEWFLRFTTKTGNGDVFRTKDLPIRVLMVLRAATSSVDKIKIPIGVRSSDQKMAFTKVFLDLVTACDENNLPSLQELRRLF